MEAGPPRRTAPRRDGLTRAAVLPFFVLLPTWVAWRRTHQRILVPGLALLTAFVVCAPWLATLYRMEGRFVPLSTKGGYNLYLGNNAWVVPGHGSIVGDAAARNVLDDDLARRAEQRGIDKDVLAQELALETIREDPAGFLQRAPLRLRHLWTLDASVMRHVLHAVYPPLSNALVQGLAVLLGISLLVLVGAGVLGLALRGHGLREPWLLPLLAAATCALPAACFGMPRFGLPALALLLPVAGHGLAHARRAGAVAIGSTFFGMAVLAWSMGSGLPSLLERHGSPSLVYADLVAGWDRDLGARSLYTDRVAFRADGETVFLTVRLLADEQWFRGRPRSERTLELVLAEDGEPVSFDIVTGAALEAPRMRLLTRTQRVGLVPIDAAHWRAWRPSGLASVEVRWEGGGAPAF